MSRRIRLITVIMTVLFALAAFAFTASASDEAPGGDGDGGGSGYSDGGNNDGGNSGGNNDGGYDGGDNDGGNSGGNSGGYDGDGGNSGGGNSGGNSNYDGGNYDDDDNDYSGNNYNNNNYNNDYDNNYNYNNNYDQSSGIYVGGGQTYVQPETTPSTTAALYDTSKTKVDEQTLSKSDWADITNNLKNPKSTGQSDSAGDFAFIQQNSSTEDNGHWMLVLGFTLIGLSIIGFIYLIYVGNSRKKSIVASRRRTTQQQAYRNDTRYRAQDDFDRDYITEDRTPQSSRDKKPQKGRRYR